MQPNDKKKILIVHNYYQIPGGEDTVVANEKKLLEEHGQSVTLYTRSNSELKDLNFAGKLLLPVNTIFNFRTHREIKSIIKKEHIDIVHVHNTLNLISPSVYYAAKSCHVPVVQTVHNFRLVCPGATFYRDGHICEDCPAHGMKCAVRHRCYRGSRLQTLACAMSTRIHSLLGIYKKINYICLTEFTKKKLAGIAPDDHIYIKPNFVFDFGGKAEPDDYYVFVGRLEEIKGINLLVDAFKLLPDIKLKIVGTGVEAETVKSRIAAEGITNIELAGYKERNEVNEIVRKSKALIMCSQWYETFGMVIAEAYSNGVPVIVGNIGNIKDLVIPDKTGMLFEYNSAKALADTVIRFEDNYSAEYGRNAYEYYRQTLTPDKNYELLSDIYNHIS